MLTRLLLANFRILFYRYLLLRFVRLSSPFIEVTS